jgi:serine O-acetyltransferase
VPKGNNLEIMRMSGLFRNIAGDIAFDRQMNRRSRSWKDYVRPFFIPQLSCLIIYRLSHLLYLCKIPAVPKLLRSLNIVLYGVDIQPEADIEGGCFIGHTVGIVIGKNVHIEEDCVIFQGVTITPGKHPGTELSEEDRIHIGEATRIYAGAKLIGNLEIGPNVIIGANAVVLDSIPAGQTVGGIPAKPIKRSGDC